MKVKKGELVILKSDFLGYPTLKNFTHVDLPDKESPVIQEESYKLETIVHFQRISNYPDITPQKPSFIDRVVEEFKIVVNKDIELAREKGIDIFFKSDTKNIDYVDVSFERYYGEGLVTLQHSMMVKENDIYRYHLRKGLDKDSIDNCINRAMQKVNDSIENSLSIHRTLRAIEEFDRTGLMLIDSFNEGRSRN